MIIHGPLKSINERIAYPISIFQIIGHGFLVENAGISKDRHAVILIKGFWKDRWKILQEVVLDRKPDKNVLIFYSVSKFKRQLAFMGARGNSSIYSPSSADEKNWFFHLMDL